MPRLALHGARISAVLAAGAMMSLGTAGPALAQTGCKFGAGSGDARVDQIPGGGSISRLGHPHFVCDDGVEIWADSAEVISQLHMTHLMGHVRYVDSTRVMRSDSARYHSDTGRLDASGNLFVQDTARGSIIRNGALTYLRRTTNRPREQMTVTIGTDFVRPTAQMYLRPAPDTTGAVPDTTSAVPDTTHTGRPDTTHTARPDTARAAARPDTAPPPVRKGPPPGGGAIPAPPATPPDTTQKPYNVQADRLDLEGESNFLATGSVKIDRDSLHARADTAQYDESAATLVLEGFASLHSAGYDLTGDVVDIALPGGQIRSLRARRSAKLVGSQLDITAPVITVFTTGGEMDRLVATGLPGEDTTSLARPASTASRPVAARRSPPTLVGRPDLLHPPADSIPTNAEDSANSARPVATSEKFQLTADSLDVRAPGQVLDKMYAVGNARGVSSAGDSLNVPSLPDIARHDWITGDTLIATFTKVQPPPDQPNDSAHYDLKQLVAEGNASSLYRIAPSDSAARPGVDPPAVHYVLGKQITIALDSGQVRHMDVVDPHGWHLEPLSRSALDSLAADSARADSLRADSARAKADTGKVLTAPRTRSHADTVPKAKARPDTTKVRPDTMAAEPGRAAAARGSPGVGVRHRHRSGTQAYTLRSGLEARVPETRGRQRETKGRRMRQR